MRAVMIRLGEGAVNVAALSAFYGILGGGALGVLVGMLAVPVMLFQSFLWLRHGVWVKLSARMFYPQSADTNWLGLNMMLDRLAEGELAAAIVVMAGGLLILSLLSAWVFASLDPGTTP